MVRYDHESLNPVDRNTSDEMDGRISGRHERKK